MDGNLLMQWLEGWLTPESLPAWIMAFIMAAGWFQQWYRGRPRPSRIVVFEANRTLFSKLPEAKSRLSMAFDGREIESLAMIELAIGNEGSSVIEDIEFTIEVNEQARILDIQPQPMPPSVPMSITHTQGEPNRWEVTIDYLNPLSLVKEQVRLAVFCEPEPDALEVRGGGKGWSLEFLGQAELQAQKEKRRRVIMSVEIAAFVVWLAFIAGLMSLVNFLLDRFFGFSRDPSRGVVLILSAIPLILIFSWGYFKVLYVASSLLKPYPD